MNSDVGNTKLWIVRLERPDVAAWIRAVKEVRKTEDVDVNICRARKTAIGRVIRMVSITLRRRSSNDGRYWS